MYVTVDGGHRAIIFKYMYIYIVIVLYVTVDGGHRAIIFSRIGGIQPDIYVEGLHFR